MANIFVTLTGEPNTFVLHGSADTEEIFYLIVNGGGFVIPSQHPDARDADLHIIGRGDIPTQNDMIYSDYIIHSVRRGPISFVPFLAQQVVFEMPPLMNPSLDPPA